MVMKPTSSRRPILVQKFIDFYHRYETLGLKITFILISLQLLHLYWLTTDVVLQKILGQSFFLVPKNLLPLFVVIDYIEIPALVSGIIFYIYSIRSGEEDSKKSYLFLGLLGVQVIHIFWITDDVVYSSFFNSSFVQIPSLLAWIAILIDYLELPVIGDLFYKVIKKKRR
jgi:hypothetical protein